MFKEISIGARKVALLANGATPLYYKQTFHKDLISKVYGSDDQIAEVNDCAPEVAFIMAKQASNAKDPTISLSTLSFEEYVKWLEGFEATNLLFKADEIMDIYFHDGQPSAEAKKKQGKRKE